MICTVQVQEEVRQLLCLLTRDNPRATEDLRSLLMDRIALTLRGHVATSDLAFAVRHEMALLAALVQKEDSCWEQKLRYKWKMGGGGSILILPSFKLVVSIIILRHSPPLL